MGLPDILVEHQDGHAAEFMCSICFGLVDAPLLTTCHHIFCMACLQQWLDEKPSCPTCSVELDPRHGAGDLRLASPLAWRVLGRLRVRCPLTGCKWQGEYSELMSHMTSSTSHQVGASASGAGDARTSTCRSSCDSSAAAYASSARQQAEALNTAARSKFEQRVYRDALTLYTKAIALAPDCATYLLNRSASDGL